MKNKKIVLSKEKIYKIYDEKKNIQLIKNKNIIQNKVKKIGLYRKCGR